MNKVSEPCEPSTVETNDIVSDMTKEERAVYGECKNDNVDSREGMFDLEGGFLCKQCDQI